MSDKLVEVYNRYRVLDGLLASWEKNPPGDVVIKSIVSDMWTAIKEEVENGMDDGK